MRTLILGCGAIGGTIAGRLARAGRDITVCTRTRPLRDEVSFLVNDRTESVSVPFVTNWDKDAFDVVILCVRPNQVHRVLAKARGSKSTFIVCQNGLCEPLVRRLVGPEARVIGAVISWAATRTNGLIGQTAPGYTTLGNYDGLPLSADDPICDLLALVHPIRLTSNLPGVRWSKLALNLAASTICILVDGHVGKSFRHPKAIWIAVQLISEVCEAATKAGVEMEVIEGTLDLKALFYPADRPLLKRGLSGAVLVFFALKYFGLESSMWRAMKVGESSGIEFLTQPVLDALNQSEPRLWSKGISQLVLEIESGKRQSTATMIKQVISIARGSS